jgi:alkyl hydroperoxide reductase subunit D
LRKTILAEAEARLSPAAIESAKGAAAVMGANNVYFRFLHLVEDEKYRTIPARLRTQAIRRHGSDPLNFELYCLAVSAINACGACMASHSKVLINKGASHEAALASVRIASVLHAVSAVIEAEEL